MAYRVKVILSICLLFSLVFVTIGFCEVEQSSNIETDSVEALIEILREKGVIDDEEAETFIQRHRGRKVPAPKADEERVITIVPEEKEEEYIDRITKDVAQEIKQDVREKVKLEIKNEMAQAEEWTQRVRFGGDIRLRYAGNFFDDDNAELAKPADPSELMNTEFDRHRARYRVRLTMKAKVNDKVDFRARLSTGNENDPVSTNDTLGDYMINDDLVFDRAYLHFRPLEGLHGWGGRFPNPWFHTDLVWDPDLNFEGMAASFEKGITDPWIGFLTLGAFPLQEVEFTTKDKWFFGGQIGLQWKPGQELSAKLGVAYFDYQRITGKVNDPLRPHENDWTAPLYQKKGNTLMDIDPSEDILTALASEFKEVNITGKIDIGVFDPVHVICVADYVQNIGFDKDSVARRTGNSDIREENEGYQFGLIVGHPKARRFGEWNTFFYYKHLEADAVVDAYTESDFHLGGTNAEGWILGGHFGLGDNLWGRVRWMTADEISGPPLAIDVLQIDVNAAF